MKVSLALIVLGSLLGSGQTWASDMAEIRTGDELREQAALYLRRGLVKQANTVLEAAYRSKGGSENFDIVFMRAHLAVGEHRIAEAFKFAGEALKLKSNSLQKSQLNELIAELEAGYGAVKLNPVERGDRRKGRLELIALTRIINPQRRRRFEAIQEGYSKVDIEVPAKLYLPYGEYLANNVRFSIVHGETSPEIEVYFQESNSEGESDDRLWWYVGIGGGVALASGITALVLAGDSPPRREVEVRVILRSLTGR